jgi:UDP-N-acetylglucosamine 2-epimerase (non-hydrolysing)
MIAYEKACLESRPDWIVVVGDVNSTAACAMVAAKLWIPVAHLEAGLRSGDRRMPEEINRVVTDAICDLLWTPSPDGDENLRREGIPEDRVERIGNIMMDSYERVRHLIDSAGTREKLGVTEGGYGVVTLHRPSNVDDQAMLKTLVHTLLHAAGRLPLVFAMHPRTRARLEHFGLLEEVLGCTRIRVTGPLGYVEFMNLISGAAAVITDSGGVQEETTYLDIPCITLRENTERPITVLEGTNRLARVENLIEHLERALSGDWPSGRRPLLWDGKAAFRAAESLRRRVAG